MIQALNRWWQDRQGNDMVAWAISFPLTLTMALAIWQFIGGLWVLSQVQTLTSTVSKQVVQQGCWTPSLDSLAAKDARTLGLHPSAMAVTLSVTNGQTGASLGNTSQAPFGSTMILTMTEDYTYRLLGVPLMTVRLNDSDGGLSQAITSNSASQQYASQCSLPNSSIWRGQG